LKVLFNSKLSMKNLVLLYSIFIGNFLGCYETCLFLVNIVIYTLSVKLNEN